VIEAVDGTHQPPTARAGSGAYARLVGAFAALAAGATAVVVGALVVHGLPAVSSAASTSTTSSATSSTTTTTPALSPTTAAGYPVPPHGAVVLGAEAGRDVLGLSVVPGHGKIGLQASVVGIQGNGLKGLSVHFDVAGGSGQKATATGTPCGAGCYRASATIGRPRSVVVRLSGERPVSFAMPATWPAPSAGALVARAGATWRKLSTIAFDDSLSDGHVTLITKWKDIAPNRVQFAIEDDGGSGIIIGDRRWDKSRASNRWVESAQYPVHQPVPFWQSATDAHLLGTVTYHGRPAWKVSFFDLSGGPAWFTILVDKGTLHTMQLWMIAQDHFMHETYTAFNTPIQINPPSSPG
jgi:hypothetical protein